MEMRCDRDQPGVENAFPAGDYVRQLRRCADLSQRQLAKASGVSRSTIERVESGAVDPGVKRLQRLLDIVAWGITVTDVDNRLVVPLREFEGNLRDGADRRYPSHLDVIVDPEFGDWWADQFGLARPPETFSRNRAARDQQRARSQQGLYRGPYQRGRAY